MAFFVNFRYKFSFFALGAYKLKFSGYAYHGGQSEATTTDFLSLI